MTATIYQLRDYQQPKDLARMYGETTLEQQAVGIVDYLNDLTRPYTETVGFTEMIGTYRADYSPLTPEQIAAPDPELAELYRNSVPYGGAGIDGMGLTPRVDLSSATRSVASLYELGKDPA